MINKTPVTGDGRKNERKTKFKEDGWGEPTKK